MNVVTPPEACKRCGSTDGNHLGYHSEKELPFKRGDRVRVRAGALLRTTLPDPGKRELVNRRSRTVTVFSVHNGMSEHIGYGATGEDLWQHIDAPAVCWPGAGGYWHYAKMSDVELAPAAGKSSV